jgi:putative transposase
MTLTAHDLPEMLSQRLACDVLVVCRNTVRSHLRQQHFCGPPAPRQRERKQSAQPRALEAQEQERILERLNSAEFCDQPPLQVYYSLLEQGEYLCSISTLHRVLRARGQGGERRAQRAPQTHVTPRLQARAPNEVWSWDITKLATEQRGIYLCLYVVMDLFSRFSVAWMLSRKENSALASQLMEQATQRYAIPPGTLTLHQDRGAPMTAHCYLDLLSELSVTPSHSRPRVSNDNPMSEAQFKTLKYQPDYPRRFKNYHHAQRWCQDYVGWYNEHHHHSALAGFTPQQVFTGEYLALAQQRQAVLDAAYTRHPERFVKGRPLVAMPPKDVYINPVPEGEITAAESGVNFPTLDRVRVNAI